MNIPSPKTETGSTFFVNSTVIVIGKGESALAAVKALSAHPIISIEESSRVVEVLGQRGNFRLKVEENQTKASEWIEAGAIVLALPPKVGIDPALPKTELIKPLFEAELALNVQNTYAAFDNPDQHKTLLSEKKIGIYVNDQANENTFTRGLQQALRFKNKGAEVNFFYFNLSLGNVKNNELYRICLESGVHFLRLIEPLYLQVKENNLQLDYSDLFIDLVVSICIDLLYVSEIYDISPELMHLAKLLKLNSISIFTNRPGIFVLNEGIEPELTCETAAAAIAGETAPLLSKELLIEDSFPLIDTNLCSKCYTCYRICPYGAISLDYDHCVIDPLACQACGVCAITCPNAAISFPLYNRTLLNDQLEKNSKHKIVVFACRNSGADNIVHFHVSARFAAKVELVKIPCACALDYTYIREALLHGAEGVILVTCPPGSCVTHSEHKTSDINRILQEMGVKPKLVKILAIATNSPALWQQELTKVLRTYVNQEVC